MSTIGLNRAVWEWVMRTFVFCGERKTRIQSRGNGTVQPSVLDSLIFLTRLLYTSGLSPGSGSVPVMGWEIPFLGLACFLDSDSDSCLTRMSHGHFLIPVFYL